MNIRHILLRYFLPMVVCFFVLSAVSLVPTIQNVYYSFFEKITLSASEGGQSDIYFKTKKGTENDPNNPDKVTVLFNSKAYLKAIMDRAKATGKQGVYNYKGFVVSVSEYFTTPLIFFFSLLLVTPISWGRKGLNLLMGGLLIIGFAYITIYFRSLYSVADAGLPGYNYDARTIKGYRLLSFAFSSVTTITVVLLLWILLAFRKNDFRQIFAK